METEARSLVKDPHTTLVLGCCEASPWLSEPIPRGKRPIPGCLLVGGRSSTPLPLPLWMARNNRV